MKLKSIVFLISIVFLSSQLILSCSNKKDDNLWLLALLGDKKGASKDVGKTTDPVVQDDTSEETTADGEGTTEDPADTTADSSESSASSEDVEKEEVSDVVEVTPGLSFEVSPEVVAEESSDSSFDGVFLTITDDDTKGFIVNETEGPITGCENAACLMEKVLGAIYEDDGNVDGNRNPNSILQSDANSGYNLISRNVVTGSAIPTEISSISIKVKNDQSDTGSWNASLIRDHYVNLMRELNSKAVISDLPDSTVGDVVSDEFRMEIQVSLSSEGAIILFGITAVDHYPVVEDELSELVDGSNVGPSSYERVDQVDNYASTGPVKADFLLSINNSATMKGEQDGMINSLNDFYDRLSELGVDFRMSVITSDCDHLWRADTVNPYLNQNSHQYRSCNIVNNEGKGSEGISDWGSGTVYYSDSTQDKSDFSTAIQNIWVRGYHRESNVYYAEMALADGGTFDQEKAYSDRSDVSTSLIIISDDPDQYDERSTELGTNKSFDKNDNIFLDKGVTVYAVYPLKADGNAGYCEGPNGNTAEAPKNSYADAVLPDLVNVTGGSSSSICSSNPSNFLLQIANQTATGVSEYKLTHFPISSTMRVYVDGVRIEKGTSDSDDDGATRFIYNSLENSIAFTGTIPAENADIQVKYEYFNTSGLAGFIAGAANSLLTLIIFSIAVFSLLAFTVYSLIKTRNI